MLPRRPMPLLFVLAVASTADLADTAEVPPVPIFDAHVHYSHDAWDETPPAAAINHLGRAGIERALVSSSPDEGTQKLLTEAPAKIIPALRPYRKRGELSTWMHDPSVIPYLEDRLARFRYVAIGEFHVDGRAAELPVVRNVIDLARQHGLWLHAHSDADAIERIFRHDPKARVLWAHAGFAAPETVRSMLDRYPNLAADLSFRSEIARADRVAEPWRSLLIDHADRFLLGSDTYTPSRWQDVERIATSQRQWLSDLPPDVAGKIRWHNGQRLFGAAWERPH